MSMLSAQCDELRNIANRFENYGGDYVSRVLREAANTIEVLRELLQADFRNAVEPILEPWDDPTKYDAYCGWCNYPIGDGKLNPWDFCPNCGTKIRKAAE